MLTGATLIDYRWRYDTGTFFKKRLIRTMVPFIAWSLLALVWKTLTHQMEMPVGPRSLIDAIFNTRIIDVYWFFFPLFSIYLMMPVLSLFVRKENFKTIQYVIVLYFIINSLFPFLFEQAGVPFNGNFSISILSGYLIFPIMGYYLAHYDMSSRNRIVLYISAATSVTMRYFLILFEEGAANSFVWSYISPAGILQGAAVFVFAKQLNSHSLFKNIQLNKVLSKLSSCSFGIYLIHMFIFYYGLAITHLDGSSLLWRTLGPVIAYIICLVVVLIGKKIPVIRRLFP